MASPHIEEVRRDLMALRRRLVTGELDEETYQRHRQLILEDLTPEEQQQVGTATPRPSGSGARLGPSGAAGSGIRTAVPTLSDLALEPGTVIFQQWRIVRELGRGGFGAVFEAQELHLQQRQAIKILDPAMVVREELLGRFRREVAVMRQLVHPRIVRVYDYREDLEQSQALISMEFVSGGTVKQLGMNARKAGVSVPLPLILAILEQMLDALLAAHQQGIVHRDVTPGNVLLSGAASEDLLADPQRDPQVKLVDFGIAALLERSELSQKSQALGTAAYVAPEILDPSAGEQGPPADVYGAGAVIYELLTGEPPLGRFEEPSALCPGLPPAVEALVLAMLNRRPPNRPVAVEALNETRRLAALQSGHVEAPETREELEPRKESAEEGPVEEGPVEEELVLPLPTPPEPPEEGTGPSTTPAPEPLAPQPPPPPPADRTTWDESAEPEKAKRIPWSLLAALLALAVLGIFVLNLVRKDPPPPPSGRLRAEPERVESGKVATLSWETHHAERVWLDPGPSGLGSQGNIGVNPLKTTTYRLMARGSGDETVVAEATVEVLPPTTPPTQQRRQAVPQRETSPPPPAPPVQDRDPGPLQVGGDVIAPVKLSAPAPSYAENARQARIEGVVIVQAIIDKNGRVTNVKVLKGLPMGLDQQAVEAVRTWTFKPATLEGKPVAVYYNLTVNFRLE